MTKAFNSINRRRIRVFYTYVAVFIGAVLMTAFALVSNALAKTNHTALSPVSEKAAKQNAPTELIHLRPQIRVEALQQPNTQFATAYIRPWMEHYLILAIDAVQDAAYVIGSADQRVVAAAGQIIYVRGRDFQVGQHYAVYRQAEPYRIDPMRSQSKPIALEYVEVASGKVVAVEADVASVALDQSFNAEVRQGDLVLSKPQLDLPDHIERLNSADLTPDGQIIRVQSSIAMAAKESVVTINRGLSHGARVGQVLSIAQQGEWVQDPKSKTKIKLPQQNIGKLMIFKTFDAMSYGYVLESDLPIHVGAQIQAIVFPEPPL